MKRDPNCRLCPLWKGNKNVCIPGRGNLHPKFLFIGEAPGEEEDRQGEVFVGRSGQLLIEHIRKFDLRSARLANVVSCRPPENREPRPEEIAACKPYLQAEILETKPEFIVAVGGTALMLLTKKTGVINWSGRLVGEIAKIPVLALMHPSYVLRSGAYEDFRKDCASIKDVADTVALFKRNFPEANISDAEGLIGRGFTHENGDAENATMIKMKARMRAQMVADLPGILAERRRDERKQARESSQHNAWTKTAN